jgi:AcrR family transcriptional regulator
MSRLPDRRATHLTADEIVREMLRQYDDGRAEPSIRTLADRLQVTPKAIYHYYGSREELVRAAINLVWEEAVVEILREYGDPANDQGEPLAFLLTIGVTARRVWTRHPRLAQHLTAAPRAERRLSGAMAIIGTAFEQLGLTADEAALAFYCYLTYIIGSVLIDARRQVEAAAAEDRGDATTERYSSETERPEDAPDVASDTAGAIDRVLGIGPADRDFDHALFEAGLRHMLESFRPPPSD